MYFTIIFNIISSSVILIGTTTLGQSGPGSNGNNILLAIAM